MKKALFVLFVLGLAIVTVVALKLRPWMQTGQNVKLGSWKFEDYDFQVWQRKRSTLVEPFSTSLFVRQRTNAWHQYYLNHQDVYRPRVILAKTDDRIVVRQGNKFLGAFDMKSGEYQRAGGGVSLEDVFWEDPPGKRNTVPQ